EIYLAQNYPNPFNTSTVISYQLPICSQVELSIFNPFGQKVVTLVSEKQSAGIHKFIWDAKGLTTGVYFYRLEANDYVLVKKMILIK
ncbi:MAG: T9SS type A sorting domain-containing protein, partial [candidate division KSB1 bacterium]|nr:T9SS type A sorting domain-containing protein [candidate division KSB1 bacterium]